MPRSLKLYIAGVVTLSAVALVVATLVFQDQAPGIALRLGGASLAPPTDLEIALGVGYWILLTVVTSALSVRLPLGTHQAVSMAPIVASMVLGGPAVAGWVAALGTTELRELRGRVPWYGTLANHAVVTLPAIVAGSLFVWLLSLSGSSGDPGLLANFLAAMVAAAVMFALNTFLAGSVLALRTGQSVGAVMVGDARATSFNNFALAPLGWLMAVVYVIQWWMTLLFALPLYTT